MVSYGRLVVIVGLVALLVAHSSDAEGVDVPQARRLQQLLGGVTNGVVGKNSLMTFDMWSCGTC